MSRQALGIELTQDRIWGRDSGVADRVILPEILDGYSDSYNSSKFPDRRHLNYTLAQLTAIGADVNRFGSLLPWNTSIIYEQNAFVVASDGLIYRSEVSANIGFDPADPLNVPSKWRELSELHGIPYLKTDTEYVDFTYHPSGLSKTDAGSWVYDISLFEGVGLVTSEIRVLHVESFVRGRSSDGYVGVDLPSGTEAIINSINQGNDDASDNTTLSAVPVNKGQSNFNIRSVVVSPSGYDEFYFKILGATQRVI
jgi:hypothetical protein